MRSHRCITPHFLICFVLVACNDDTNQVTTDLSGTIDKRVSASSDDAEQHDDGRMYLTGSGLELTVDGTTNQTVGVRFAGLAIPRGATITNAWVQLTAKEVWTGATVLTIKAQAADNASTFTKSRYNLSNRPTTVASVEWTVAPWNVVDEAAGAEQSPSLVAVVQEIVNRGGWSSGNAIALIFTGSGTRTAYSVNSGGSTRAPLLHIEYTTGATCGNGIIEAGEQCDGETCCAADCTLASAGTVCRAAAGSCDLAETCTGSDAACPADSAAPDGTSCSGGTCQAGSCQSGGGGDPWSTPFLSRTPSGPLRISNQSNVVISGKQFTNLGAGVVAIEIENCSNITITENDFDSVTGAIYLLNSSNVTITWNRYRNIGDDTIGSGHSNFVQLNTTFGGYIGHNKGKGGLSEDIISIYKSGGSSASSPLIIEYNQFEGTNWDSSSGSGTMLGDAGGSHVVVRNNTMLTPGQVGIGVASGTDIHVTDNLLYGAQRTDANVGISVWNQYSTTCSSIEVARNQVKWYNASGAENPYWNAGNCGPVSGESTNNWHAPLDPSTMHVTL